MRQIEDRQAATDEAALVDVSGTMEKLGDFITSPRLLFISGIAIGIGAISAFVALALLKLIGLFTNLFFYQRWNGDLVSPSENHLGMAVIFVPVLGAFLIGLIARYGSERIRGHGIPEAIESILMNGSRVEPKVALLKPVSAAISIGSGGPFGAEGPIIMTGGAVGSLIAQLFHLSSTERKTLLVAGAAGGMAATFAAPVAAILLAVELLLFEWRPRSAIPVALSSVTAAVLRRYLLSMGPLFPTAPIPAFIGPAALVCCALAGVLAGLLSAGMTFAVYAAEDAFQHLPIHWMWWPLLGGLVIGIGGLIFPPALGVGYDVIGTLLSGSATLHIIIGVLLVKSVIWAISLGSGTSGGVLAPLLMMGGALGALEALVLPHVSPGFWALISMGAILGGTMRSPLTGIVFALELTHDINALAPLTLAVFVAHGFTVLTLRRSILTEKISRRGFHLSREYAVDPLEFLFVREVMRTNIVALPADAAPVTLARSLRDDSTDRQRGQHLYPVVDAEERLLGVLTRRDLHAAIDRRAQAFPDGEPDDARTITAVMNARPVVAFADEPLRSAVYRMAETGFTQFPVVSRSVPGHLVGLVSLRDMLRGRERSLTEERQRERMFHLRLFLSLRATRAKRRADV